MRVPSRAARRMLNQLQPFSANSNLWADARSFVLLGTARCLIRHTHLSPNRFVPFAHGTKHRSRVPMDSESSLIVHLPTLDMQHPGLSVIIILMLANFRISVKLP